MPKDHTKAETKPMTGRLVSYYFGSCRAISAVADMQNTACEPPPISVGTKLHRRLPMDAFALLEALLDKYLSSPTLPGCMSLPTYKH